MTSSLRELEQRLEREPDNLPLRVTVAGKLREAVRADAAVEHYRKVAIAYRSQGRAQQALAVCENILELAPDDIAIHALVKDLEARMPTMAAMLEMAAPRPQFDEDGVDIEFSEVGDAPRDPVLEALAPQLDPDIESVESVESVESDDATRPIDIKRPVVKIVPSPAGTRGAAPRAMSPNVAVRKSGTFETETPLPNPLPYHIADPTSAKLLVSIEDLDENIETRPGPIARPPSEPGTTGLAQAARRISGMITNPAPALDLAQELETRQHVRLSALEIARVSRPPPTVPIEHVDLDDDAPTPIPDWAGNVTSPGGRASDEEDLTVPLEKLATAPIANAFFVSLPQPRRDAALARCIARTVTAGTTVIRLGETGHPLILVVRGQLEVRHDRPHGTQGSYVPLDTIETGQFIGEAALLARTPAPANIVAVTDSDVLSLPPHALFELAGAYPALWAALKDSAERRTRQYDKLLRGS